MPHLFHPYADTVARSVLLTIVIAPFLAIGIAYWLTASAYETGRTLTVDQPVPFSHQHHVGGLGLDCRYCHTGVETSAVAGVPPTHTCMTCHSQLYTQAAMLALVRESLSHDRPIHWNKVNRLPDYVYFDHSVHIAKGVGHSPWAGASIVIATQRRIFDLRQMCSIRIGGCQPTRASRHCSLLTKVSTTNI
jgi:hypothetical protein